MKVDLESENVKKIDNINDRVNIMNKEFGEFRDIMFKFRQDNAIEHTKIFESLKNQNIYIKDIKQSLNKLGWGLATSVIIMVLSIFLTNIIK